MQWRVWACGACWSARSQRVAGCGVRRIAGLGTGDDVPQLLRHEGAVVNKHMVKQEAEQLIWEVWAAKEEADAAGAAPVPLAQVLATCLNKKHVHVAARVTEVSQGLIAHGNLSLLHPSLMLRNVAPPPQPPPTAALLTTPAAAAHRPQAAYNFIACLGQHLHDPDCALFLRVLSGELDAVVRSEQMQLQAELLRALQLVDKSINQQVRLHG